MPTALDRRMTVARFDGTLIVNILVLSGVLCMDITGAWPGHCR